MTEPSLWVHPLYLVRRAGMRALAIDATLDQIAPAQIPLYSEDPEPMKQEIHDLKLKLQTMESDRDAEKDMKAKARIQRDKQTHRATKAIELLNSIQGINDHTKWLEVKTFLASV